MHVRDRIVQIIDIPGDKIRPNSLNWRTHPDSQKDAIRGILAEVGMVDVLKVVPTGEGDYVLVDGHARAEILGSQPVKCAVLDLTQEEVRKVLATFDPIAGLAGRDQQMFDDLAAMIETDNEALAAMIAEMASDPVPDDAGAGDEDAPIDKAAELQKAWQTERGQIWGIPSKTVPGRSHRVMCGDCRETEDVARLLDGQKVNVAFTSPPYASQRKYDEESGFMPIKPDSYVEWFEAVQSNVRAHLAADGSWFVNIKEHCEDGQRHLYVKDLTISHVRQWVWRFVDEFCWKRPGPPGKWPDRFKNSWEPVFHFANGPARFRPENVTIDTDAAIGDGQVIPDLSNGEYWHLPKSRITGKAWPSNVLEVGSAGAEASGHQAAFPVALPTFFIKAYSDPGDVIFDPFLGSGTTMIAAEREGRIGVGMELSPKYLGVILERAKNEGLEPRLTGGHHGL